MKSHAMNINKLNLIPLSLASFTILTGTILVSSIVSADDSVVDEINITVPVSCTMTGTGMDSHNAEINNGQYDSNIGETTMKAFCNDNNGFAIYAIGYTDDEDGKNVLTNSTLGSTHDIVTGTALSGDTSNWAMKLSTITSPAPTYPIVIAGSTDDTDKEQGDPDFTAFQAVPADYTLVAKRTAGTDIGTTAEGATLKSTYQAYISRTQPAGTYTGQVKYTLVHPHDATKPHKKIYMQDLTSTTIAQLLPNTHDTAIVVDKRDEQEYTIAKLADGKYWMTENLNIAGGTALSSEDTDFDSSYALPTTGNWTVEDGKLVLPDFATEFDGTRSIAYVYNSNNRDCSNDQPCFSYYSWDAATAGSGRNTTIDNPVAMYSICPKGWRLPTSGVYRNGQFESGDYGVLASAYGANLADSGNGYGDSSVETGSAFYSNAGPGTIPNFVLAGMRLSGQNYNFGSGAYYWSSNPWTGYEGGFNNDGVRFLHFNNSSIETAYPNNNDFGNSIRCLLRTN